MLHIFSNRLKPCTISDFRPKSIKDQCMSGVGFYSIVFGSERLSSINKQLTYQYYIWLIKSQLQTNRPLPKGDPLLLEKIWQTLYTINVHGAVSMHH